MWRHHVTSSSSALQSRRLAPYNQQRYSLANECTRALLNKCAFCSCLERFFWVKSSTDKTRFVVISFVSLFYRTLRFIPRHSTFHSVATSFSTTIHSTSGTRVRAKCVTPGSTQYTCRTRAHHCVTDNDPNVTQTNLKRRANRFDVRIKPSLPAPISSLKSTPQTDQMALTKKADSGW